MTFRDARQWLICAAAALLVIPVHAQVTWQLHDNQCPERDVPGEFSCGDYGRFYVDGAVPAPGCPLLAQGSEVPLTYFAVRNVAAFPDQVQIPVPRRATVVTPYAPAALSQPAAGVYSGSTPWLAMIDFDGAHGLSVHWLAQAVAGEGVPSTALLLDDALTNPDGDVSDLDVLRALCSVAQTARQAPHLRPVVNMSFGRPVVASDPVDGGTCATGKLSCQIHQVSQHLVARDAILVGAAGKQREWLFPAALDTVIAVGLLDPSQFSSSTSTQPTWEMPPGTRALMPGNSLCLRGGWPAPSGASYSSAILAGWLAITAAHSPALDLSNSTALEPIFSAARQCHVLGNGAGGELSLCNAFIESIFNGIGGEYDAQCWQQAMTKTITATLGPPTMQQPELVGVVQWNAQVRPAPEGDPCVPCTGSSFALRVPTAGDLSINLSSTRPMRPQLVIESLHVRVDEQFYALNLDADVLAAFRDGNVDELILKNAAALIQTANSASLFFRLRDSAVPDCSELVGTEPACGWMATHIHTL